jgi:glycosyltransferase involved in cell wall biosynthesis
VAVVLPVRDGAAHLPECIASLEGQTLEDVEFMVVDDGSADATPEILEAWARGDPRVRVLRQPRVGLVAALERARAAASAPVLARMDHDDVALPDRLAAQLERLDAAPDVVLCGCGVEYVSSTRLGDGALRYQTWLNSLVAPADIERDLFVECPLAHPTFMVRAPALAAVGGYRDRGWPEDYDLVLRLWEAGGRFAKVPEVLLRWRDRPDRLSRTAAAYTPEAFRRCKVDALARTLLRGRDGVVVWGAGPTGKAFARTLTDAGCGVRAFVDLDPRKIGQRVHGAPVVDPGEVGAFRGSFCVAAVGQEGAREQIRRELVATGWREMVDFCAVA